MRIWTAFRNFRSYLKGLFQFEASDLDFGIYRILNYKRDRIEKFIQGDIKNKGKIIQSLGCEFKPTKGGKNMREILCEKGLVREWYNRTRFVYTTKTGRISKIG